MSRQAAAASMGILALCGCTRHAERELTAWLKVDVVRPITGTSGVMVVGSNEEVFSVKVGNEWQRLGSGHPSRYMVLDDPNKEPYEPGAQPAALVDVNDGKGMQVVRAGEESLRPLAAAFGRSGGFSVPSSRTAVDFWDCRDQPAAAGCRDLQIHRHHPSGALVTNFTLTVPDTYAECRLQGVRWYGDGDIPLVTGDCPGAERAQCLLLAPRKDGLLVRAVGKERPSSDCSDYPGLGIAKGEPAHFEVLY